MVAIICAIIGWYTPPVHSAFGNLTSGETNYLNLGMTGLKVGPNCGDSFKSTTANGCKATAHFLTATCSMQANLSVTATTTNYEFCTGVTGVTSSDNILATFASSTGVTTLKDNWVIVGAKASTTAGAIDFTVMNLTGTNNVPSAVSQIGSTTNLVIFQ